MSAEPADLQLVKGALFDARRELIDLTRKNRLLHSPLSGKRPHCLEIINIDPDFIFGALTRSAKKFGFIPGTDADVKLPPQRERPSAQTTQRLQTKLAPEALERRLLKFYREARTFEEEQGVNILFLAIGFLNWFEDARSEERCSAPLLLVPVFLERLQGSDSFVLKGRDDDLVVNVSLAEKLRGSFGIALPEFPEGDEWTPNAYFDSIATAVARESRWEVDRNAAGLGFFTFSRFLMWRDLDAATWPDAKKLLEHVLLGRLLGGSRQEAPEAPLVSEEEAIDRHVNLADTIHVLDADSSQTLCIEEARRGRNLVIQGPPGTGKSQTIANIIAAAAHEGKSVLFVAEKAAALDVVHGRLKAVGLEPLCLEIHSKKATKVSVISSLERSMSAGNTTKVDDRNLEQLRVARDLLNGWSATLHREIGHSGRTPFQLMGKVLKLRHTDGVRVLGQRLEAAADWDRDRLQAAVKAVERAAAAVHKIGVAPVNYPFYGTSGIRLTPFDAERLTRALGECWRQLNELIMVANSSATYLKADRGVCCQDVRTFVQVLRHLARVPQESKENLAHAAWWSERVHIEQLVEHGKASSLASAEILPCVLECAWTVDTGPLRQGINAHGRSIFRFFFGTYRRAVAGLRGICQTDPPKRYEDRIALLDKLLIAQRGLQALKNEREFGKAVLGGIWADGDTSWTSAEALLNWARDGGAFQKTFDLAGLAPSAEESLCTSLANDLEAAVNAFRAGFTRIAEIMRMNPEEMFGVRDVEHVVLSSVAARLQDWIVGPAEFNDWVTVREALDQLVSLKMGAIAEGIKNGGIKDCEAVPITELLIAEALWNRARLGDPILDQIDGAQRSRTVLRFRELDRKRIQLASSEVLGRYLDRRPDGQAGQMGIIRAEIGKKRRHLPIRKLMEQAGSAVQKLKPVFLMSPLSVAQFLPPGRITFDLVVIDEASQVSPEEALGVIARGRQIVVVGDDKQLPPTNFFKMASPDDDEEVAETADVSGRTRDFESILTLARARGVAERMLRWHYRSKHPSLIALSNKECYANRLLLPPSPDPAANDLGLSFVPTPPGHYDRGGTGRNPVEADLIAAAVEEHLVKWPDRSLGLACFSVAQRDALEDALQSRGVLAAVEAFAPKGERVFIKNLEAVQGDERDVIYISIGYGRDGQNRMTAGFGPISSEGGERRLNVLITRARLQCTVFSSMTAGDIPADAKPRGTRMLREFLHYAETKHIAVGQVNGADFDSPFEEAVSIAISRKGYEVFSQVGVSGFRIDLGVLDPEAPGRFILGIECDGASYHSARSARDRDRLRQEVLESLGWTLYRIWSTDWFRNPAREAEKVFLAIERARAHANPPTIKSSAPTAKTHPGPSNLINFVLLPDSEKSSRAENTPGQTPKLNIALAEAYKECQLHVPVGLDLTSISSKALGELCTTVVLHEGPIHVEEVALRVREAFGLGRTTRRIVENIVAALVQVARQGLVTQDGEFWTASNRILKNPRCRRNASDGLRRADRIAPVEYRLAIDAVLRADVGASIPETTIGVARILGFDRTGHGLDSAISQQIDTMVRDGQVQASEGKLQLTQSTEKAKFHTPN
jgi:very-short-patch-repair endonuclease